MATKEEQDFVDNLLPQDKEYWIIPKKEMPIMYKQFKVVYYSWWERIIRKLLNKDMFDK